MIDETQTDAILFLSVLPSLGLGVIGDKDWKALVDRCRDFNTMGRRVMLRFAPGRCES